MRYRVSEEAEQDLDGIFLYWANRASLEAANRIIDRITERFWLLGEHPNAGKPAGNIARGVKCFPAGKYLIYYRHTRGGTDILHIFHGARDQRRALRNRARIIAHCLYELIHLFIVPEIESAHPVDTEVQSRRARFILPIAMLLLVVML